MANNTQLEADDKPKQADVDEKPKQPVTGGKPKQAEAGDKPKQADVDDKPKQPEAGDKPKQEDGKSKSSLKKAGKILLYALIAVAVLVFVKYKFFTPPKVVFVQVGQQDYEGEVMGTGTINVDVLATVGAKIPGRIESLLVNEGDTVRSGQVVAALEDADIRHVVERSEARVEVARATERAKSAAEHQASRAWEREKHLVATGAVSREEADQYEERERTAEAEVVAARSEISAMEADVRLQQFNLSQTKIFTYVNGVVTDRPKRTGDAIVAGETVITVADPAVTLVEAYLDQRFAGQIKPGQKATVILRGKPKEPIAGRVYRIRPQADPAAEEMTVEVSFPLPPADLQIGQWADVYVQVSHNKNALVVPKTAISTMTEERFVLVVDAANRVRQVNIQSLASSPRSKVMAVTGDLKPGDRVLTQPMGINPGQKVRPTQSSGATDPHSMGSNPAMKM
jgi:RND family efflux transporter MFP subunit